MHPAARRYVQLSCWVSSSPYTSLWFLLPVHGALSAPDGNVHKEVSSYRCSPSALGSVASSTAIPACAFSPDHSTMPTSRSTRDTSEASIAFALDEAHRAREALAKIFSSMKTTHRASQSCVCERVRLETQDACSHFSHSRATV